ncbi:MAG: UDP-N-acetylmuramoyl-tripeptide--D-alanyl-D-alanine ligase [Nitrospirota bacterium]
MKNLSACEENIMGMLEIEDIIAATKGKVIHGNITSFTGVSIDSRTIKEGELFIPLKGERFDGHDFLKEALRTGGGALVNFPGVEPVNNKTIVCVKDTLKALQDIARYIRSRRNIPVIGVTGSNGKTTTKELIASVLNERYRVLKNTGNLNNHIGLPLSLVKLSETDEVVVLEMGASAPGDIRQLCRIALPDYGVLTNISQAHLEGFRDIQTVTKAKLELLDYCGSIVVNSDDPLLMEGIRDSGFKGRLIRYGIKNYGEIYASDIKLSESGSKFLLHTEDNYVEVHPKISGAFNIYNILAAASVGYLFNLDLTDIKNVVDSFTGIPMRFELKEFRGVRIINDVYNANPGSIEEAVKELIRLGKGRVIVVLGDMLELGSYAEQAHKRLGRWMSELPIDIFIAVGPLMSLAASEFSGIVYKFQNSIEAGGLLREICTKGDTVLIKGSRGMRMERILEAWNAL